MWVFMHYDSMEKAKRRMFISEFSDKNVPAEQHILVCTLCVVLFSICYSGCRCNH